MPLLNAEQILAAEDRKFVKVPVPEWGAGAKVLVGTMGALTRARIEDWLLDLHRRHSEPPSDDLDDGSPVTCDSEPPKDADSEVSEPGSYTHAQNTELMIRWCAACVLDPQTKRPAFTDEQVEALGDKSEAALLRVYKAAVELNLATAKAGADAEKNSERTGGGDSGSVSP